MRDVTIRDYIGNGQELIQKFSLKDAKDFAERIAERMTRNDRTV